MSEVLISLAQANLAIAAAVLAVLLLRRPARRLFGPRLAYGLWLLVPLAALATLLPARIVTVTVRAAATAPADTTAMTPAAPLTAAPPALDLWPWLTMAWVLGAALSFGWIAWRQRQFDRDVKHGLAGPAAVGVLTPRVVTPSDFAARYTPREQFVVLAHEETHIERHDTRINAVVVAARCLNWFNPLIHVLARCLRIDQELACDAQVIRHYPRVRRSYAEAMLKTQLAARPLPLGCYWPTPRAHPLTERVRLLSQAAPHPREQMLGMALLTTLALVAVGAVWGAKPVEVRLVELPATSVKLPTLLTRLAATEPPPLAPMSNRATPPTVRQPIVPPASTAPGAAQAEAHADAQRAPGLQDSNLPRSAYERSAGPRPDPRPERPPRRVYAAAERSSVEPGSAVRVIASTTDEQGRPLMTDLTSFGSQHFYRTGHYVNSGSRERLFTSVKQRAEQLWVTASLGPKFFPDETATLEMRAGETRELILPNGRVVTITPELRPETPEEIAGDAPALRRAAEDIARSGADAWRVWRDRCRTEGC